MWLPYEYKTHVGLRSPKARKRLQRASLFGQRSDRLTTRRHPRARRATTQTVPWQNLRRNRDAPPMVVLRLPSGHLTSSSRRLAKLSRLVHMRPNRLHIPVHRIRSPIPEEPEPLAPPQRVPLPPLSLLPRREQQTVPPPRHRNATWLLRQMDRVQADPAG